MLGLPADVTPYCGSPPTPDALWARWNLDPVLMAGLLAILGSYMIGVLRPGGPGKNIAGWRRGAFVVGWMTAAAALISPLCALSVSLFSARVGQHMILSLVAAPLVMLGRPGWALTGLRRHAALRLDTNPPPAINRAAAGAAAAFAVALWFWHAPRPYDATFASPIIYWLMHLTMFAAALMVWKVVLEPHVAGAVPALTAGAASTLQMTLLGAIITLAPRLLYAPHALTPYAWGLTQASDQQLGGLIMWVPGCSIFLAVTLLTLGRVMSERAHPDAPA